MTNTPDELQRVWRVVEAIPAINDLSAQYQNDIAEALLSERAELLATVERMRGALEFYADEDNWFGVYMVGRGPMGEDWSQDGNPDWPNGKPGRCAREILGWTVAEIEAHAALTTGEATIRLAASPQGEDDWITHDGGPSPVPGKMVDVRFRGSDVEDHTNCHSETWTWEHDGEDYDIIAYRVTEGVKP